MSTARAFNYDGSTAECVIFMKYFMSKHDIWQDHPGGMSELKSSLIWVVVVLKIPIHLQKLWKNRKKY